MHFTLILFSACWTSTKILQIMRKIGNHFAHHRIQAKRWIYPSHMQVWINFKNCWFSSVFDRMQWFRNFGSSFVRLTRHSLKANKSIWKQHLNAALQKHHLSISYQLESMQLPTFWIWHTKWIQAISKSWISIIITGSLYEYLFCVIPFHEKN